MVKLSIPIFVFYVIITFPGFGQESDTGPGYQLVMINNPAFSGTEGEGVLRLSYLNFFPGNSYNLHSVYLSYDSYFPSLHGGAGFYLIDDYQGGIINDIRGGISYAYFLQAGKDLYINAGLSASIYNRSFSFNNSVLPDQIDPLGGVSIPSGETLVPSGRTIFDVGAGFVIISGNIFGGFSINHLAEPDLSGDGSSQGKLKRKFQVHLSSDFTLKRMQSLKVRPQIYMELQDRFVTAGAGAVVESNYLSVNAMMLADNAKNVNMQTGFSLKREKLCIYYSYRFNVLSGNQIFPMSLLHQTGLSFSLINVEKRKQIKTINFPKL